MNIKKRILLTGIISLSLFVLVDRYVDFNISGECEGFYLSRNIHHKVYEISDHLVVGKEKRLIYAFNITDSYFHMTRRLFPKGRDNRNHLYCEWNPWDGNGLVSSYFSDGSGLITYLGRYLDNDEEVHGLFVGGGIPETVEHNNNYNMNNSGMTYYDGQRWFHIWCSVNEGIGSPSTGKTVSPSQWKFISSKVKSRSNDKVEIASSHTAIIDNIPVRINREMHFTAGEAYFTLEIKITNIGKEPLFYSYLYGDEPWVGFYGTSLGDVGWVKDRIINYEEAIDPAQYSFVGMADLGNRVIGERPAYTNLANFIEWFGPELPTEVYFTNDYQHFPNNERKVPLASNERFVGLRWDRALAPSESTTVRLAIGMARLNTRTGIPEKPPTSWK